MITIAVTVNGGTAPLPIKLTIDNLDNQHDIRISKDGSFTQDFDLPTGRYMIVVSGMNAQEGGTTDVSVTGTFASGPMPSSTSTATNQFYSVLFYGEI